MDIENNTSTTDEQLRALHDLYARQTVKFTGWFARVDPNKGPLIAYRTTPPATHPLQYTLCLVCSEPLGGGVVAMVVIGRDRNHDGSKWTATCLPVHDECAR